jgi:hypothetical protein
MKNFEIEIIDQHWIDGDPDNTTDMCSHGIFRISINGQTVLSAEDGVDDWTTSTSVLRLLRTIDDDFQYDRDFGIILHCGMIEMISCPIALDWLLWHEDDVVWIKDIKKYLTTNDADVIEYPNLTASIPLKEYKNEIAKVALQVKEFFATSKPRKYYNDQERLDNIKFWSEFDSLLSRHS